MNKISWANAIEVYLDDIKAENYINYKISQQLKDLKLLMTHEELDKLNIEADDLIFGKDHEAIDTFLAQHTSIDYSFEHSFYEAQYLFTIANCYAELYNVRRVEWYSDDLTNAVIYFRKALYLIPSSDGDMRNPNNAAFNDLKSMILTNLGNHLSSQGRALCCIPMYDQAINLTNKTEAIASKARNQMFLAESLYDNGHKEFHYFTTYKLINDVIVNIDQLYPEDRSSFQAGGYFYNFKRWFESTFDISSFDYFNDKFDESETKKEKDYLQWCAKNHLFINDLNDVCINEIVYQDVLCMPPFTQTVNDLLTMHEELSYHGHFDELKNDFCYARYLFFTAQSIPEESEHFFNSTYQHVDDMSFSINNLKINHYKTSFKTLYALFDKIAYFISHFYDLNELRKDSQLSFDTLFRDLSDKKWRSKWKPNKKLKDNNNPFLHALFYILNDIRNVTSFNAVSKWIDPDAKAFSDIRNAMEHRSLKIISDHGFELVARDSASYVKPFNEKKDKASDLNKQIECLQKELDVISKPDCSEKDKKEKSEILKKIEIISSELDRLQFQINEKIKLSSHSLLIPISQFEQRLITMMQLVRNSIMYLSLAIHFDEKKKGDDIVRFQKEVPLKN